MSKTNSITSNTSNKPEKPYSDFPLFAHPNGSWAKKIRGKCHYFGPWHNPDAALEKYLKQKDYLHSGRKPRFDTSSLTVKDICNAFLNHKNDLMEAGELSPLTFRDYKAASDLVIDNFGINRLVDDLAPDDFADIRNKMARNWGAVRVRDFVQRIRSIFKHAFEVGLLETPMRFGPGFKRPTKKSVRLERAKKGRRMFEADELTKIIEAASQPMKSMILLAINCALGNSDCGQLAISAVDLESGWMDYPRPKTGVNRRCPLWPETVAALKEWFNQRPQPKTDDCADHVFVTIRGNSWHNLDDRPISKEMRKLLNSLGINGNRNFYALRHTFRTVADEVKDQPAIDFIMGHARDDMASVYRERISDERLLAVTEYVRNWLFNSD